METKELKISIPEGQEIDWQESAKQEKIIFKKKDTKPRSWEEYCKLMKINNRTSYDILNDSSINATSWMHMNTPKQWRNSLPSKELAEAFLAMMQLMSLRQAWVGDWEPDWENNDYKFDISCKQGKKFLVITGLNQNRPLSFPTQEMASDFIDCFKDLLEVAKPLI